MKEKDKRIAVAAVVLVIILLIGALSMRKGKAGLLTTSGGDENLPTSEILPTVDASVLVGLTANKKKSDVTMSIKNMPTGTKTLEYELSYNTEGDIPKGTAASPIDVSAQSDFEKTITLGTCSSGTCVIDKVVGKIKVTIKFEGSYGKRLFEKDFEI